MSGREPAGWLSAGEGRPPGQVPGPGQPRSAAAAIAAAVPAATTATAATVVAGTSAVLVTAAALVVARGGEARMMAGACRRDRLLGRAAGELHPGGRGRAARIAVSLVALRREPARQRDLASGAGREHRAAGGGQAARRRGRRCGPRG